MGLWQAIVLEQSLFESIRSLFKVIQIHLLNVTSGNAEINPRSGVANITILANDEPHGVIHFTHKAYNVIEGNHEKTMIVHLEVTRDYGTFGDVRLYYR